GLGHWFRWRCHVLCHRVTFPDSKGPVMANFKEIMAMCLDGVSYSAIASALGCSRRDIAKTKAVIASQSVTKESFPQFAPEFFEHHFGDNRTVRKKQYHLPDFQALAKRL